MLLVPTCQVRDPLLLGILMKADDLALHGSSYAPDPTDGNHHLSTILLLHKSRGVHGPGRGPGALWWPIRMLKP